MLPMCRIPLSFGAAEENVEDSVTATRRLNKMTDFSLKMRSLRITVPSIGFNWL